VTGPVQCGTYQVVCVDFDVWIISYLVFISVYL
jgi:hypothetical protein